MPAELLISNKPHQVSHSENVTSPVVFFIGGMFSGRQELSRVKDALDNGFGGDSVVVGSAVNIKDRPIRGRNNALARQIEERMEEGSTVIFSGHSLAGEEMVPVLNRMDQSFLQDSEKRQLLKLRPVSPVIFWRRLEALRRYLRVINEQGPRSKNSPVRGVDSAVIIPPEGISRSDMIAMERRALSGQSDYRPGVSTVEGDLPLDYSEYVLPKTRPKVAELDQQFRGASTETVSELLASRGDLLYETIERVYPLPGDVEGHEPFRLRDIPRMGAQAVSVVHSMRGTRSLKQVEKWSRDGLDVKFIGAEFDPFGSSDKMPDFYKDLTPEEAFSRYTMMPGTGHSSFAVQPDLLVRSLKRSLE